MSEEEFFTVITEPDENQRWQYIVACGHWTHDEDKANRLVKKLTSQSARIAELEKEVERLRVELKSWAMRLGYRDSDTHAFDYITFIHAKAAEVSAERDDAVELITKISSFFGDTDNHYANDAPGDCLDVIGEMVGRFFSPTNQEGR